MTHPFFSPSTVRKYIRLSLIAFALSLVLAHVGAIAARAHWADLSTAEIDIQPSHIDTTITLPTQWVSFADHNQDQRLSRAEIQDSRVALEAFLSDRLPFTNRQAPADAIALIIPDTSPQRSQPNSSNDPARTANGLADSPQNSRAVLATEGDSPSNTHSTLTLRHQWNDPLDDVVLRYYLFAEDSSNAQALATVVQNDGQRNANTPEIRHVVFTPDSPTFSLETASLGRQFVDFLLLGIGHILTGYDHILFLVSLLVVGGGLRELWKIVTAFTLAHSITLSLAVLNIVTLPSIWVERAIALSLIYIAAENIFRRDIKHRWRLTFAFGLIHGLGFAGILQDLNLATANLPLVLTSFNLGVEIGQLVIISITFMALQWIQQQSWAMKIRYLVSSGAVAMGCVFLLQRFSLS